MGKKTVYIDRDVELTFDEPAHTSSLDRTVIVASAVAQEFLSNSHIMPSTRSGSLSVTIAGKAYQIYYKFKVRKVLRAVEIYSSAISHIENNMYLYDQRLARKAIKVLRKAFRDDFT
jgi:hypothetical protein